MSKKFKYSPELYELMNKYLPENFNEDTPIYEVLEGKEFFPKILSMLEKEKAAEIKRIEKEKAAELKRLEEERAAELKREEEKRAAKLKRQEEKKRLREEVNSLINVNRPLFTKLNNTQALKIINRATEIIKNGTYEEYKQAKIILDTEYLWIADEGYRFKSTLSDYYVVLGRIELDRRIEDNKREVWENMKKAEKAEKDEAYMVYYFSLVAIIIGIIILFSTGHWFFGILGIIFFIGYALARSTSLFYKYNEQAKN